MDLQQFPSISYRHQPNFASLVAAVTERLAAGLPITVVCGAGVSLDAGLPDWAKLVRRMTQAVHDRDIAALVDEDPVDQMRKVDYILRLASPRTIEELVRDSLYPDGRPVLPGNLAGAIARFYAAGHGLVRLITTNYDDQIEGALMRYFSEREILSFGLADAASWRQLPITGDSAAVLHLNGMVGVGRTTIGPIVLSESSFLEHGDAVTSVLIEELQDSCTVFVGISMTDPNLVKPLSALTSATGRFFILSIDEKGSRIESGSLLTDLAQAPYRYSRIRDAYLQESLGLQAIRLKAPSQIQQIFVELTLASQDRMLYSSDDATSSLRYGYRLQRAMGYAYSAIGLGPDRLPSGAKGRSISQCLFEALWQQPTGPGALLRSWANDLPPEWLRQMGLSRDYLRGEEFALFLWLRACQPKGEVSALVPYALRLIGCSAYSHRESWSTRHAHEVPIEPSDFVAADAAFLGRVERRNLRTKYDERIFRVWESAVAVPLVWQNPSNLYDVVTLGVLTLNSTRRLIPFAEMTAAAAQQLDVQRALSPSSMSLLDAKQTTLLEESLRDAGLSLVTLRRNTG